MEQKVVHDRISELPEVLRQHILSFLSTTQVVQSTLLSTAWKHVWITFPNLRFDRIFFPTEWTTLEVERKKHYLHNFVEKTLQIRKEKRLPINNFTLTDCWVEEKSLFCVYYWIVLVIESDVQELNLDFRCCAYSEHFPFPLPQPVLIAKSLTVLTLRSLKLDSTCVNGDCDINLPCLKQLSLTLVYTDDQIIQNLLAGCPAIEYINFESCHGFKSINLTEVPKLMTFRVRSNKCSTRLELAALNLSCLSIFQDLTFELNLLPFKNLKELSLHSSEETDKWLELHDHLSGFPLLETLSLNPSYFSKTIEISCHHLKSLDILYKCKMAEVKIDAPKLCRFTFSHFGGYIKSFSLNALALSYAFYGFLDDIYLDWNNKFLSMLNISKLFELLISSSFLKLCIPSIEVLLVIVLSFDDLQIDFFQFIVLFVSLYIYIYIPSCYCYCI